MVTTTSRSTTPRKKTPKKRPEPTPAHLLFVHTEEAKSMLADMGSILDDGMVADYVEGETGLHEVMHMAINRMFDIDILLNAIAATLEQIKGRQHRLKEQQDLLRTRLAIAMEIAEITKIESPLATASYRRTPPGVVITEESAIPSAYWKPQEPRLDRRKVLEDLKAGQAVPGATLDNGGTTISLLCR
mgnify:CR=1 FL=1